MRFSGAQKRTLAALVLAYTAAYICRTNVSMSLAAIIADFSITQTRGGLLATAFAVVYAVGQVVVGSVADRIHPRRFILTGLLASSALSALCSVAPSFGALLALWCANGAAQAMLWTPIVRILSLRFAPEAREKASFALSVALVAGYVASWGLAGALVSAAGWRQAFAIPAAIAALLAVVSAWLLGDVRREEAAPEKAAEGPGGMLKTALATGLCFVLLGGAFNGFMRDSIMTWAPKILMDTQGLPLDGVLGVALIIPAVNVFGLLYGRACYRWTRRSARRCTAVMLLLGSLGSALLTPLAGLHPLVCAALLAAIAATANGLNPMITTLIPLEYDRLGKVGAAAGLVDASIYLGSSLSGWAAGAVAERAGWQAVFALWLAAGILGAALLIWASRAKYMKNL